MSERKRRSNHECPPWCHRCPKLKGELMPMCIGVAQPGVGMECCTCDRRATWVTRLKDAEVTALRAHKEILDTRQALAVLREDHLRLERYCRSRWGVLPWDAQPVKVKAPDPAVYRFVPKGTLEGA